MAFTSADLDAIRSAIAKGEASVTFADRTVTYRSIEDLLRAEAAIKASLESRPRQTLVVGNKGFGA